MKVFYEKVLRRCRLPLCLLLCLLLTACNAKIEDPLAYQCYPIMMQIEMQTAVGTCYAQLTVEAAGCGTMTLHTAQHQELYTLTVHDGRVTVSYQDQSLEIVPHPMCMPPVFEMVSLFSLSPGDEGIRGEERILADGAFMTVHEGVPQRIVGADYEAVITSFRSGTDASTAP